MLNSSEKRPDYDALAKKLEILRYTCKDSIVYVPDYLYCGNCGNTCVSVNDGFIPVGECYYCGFKNTIVTCDRCNVFFHSSDLIHGFCENCRDYFDKQ